MVEPALDNHDLPHGALRYRRRRNPCRCDICRDAHAADVFEVRGRRYDERVEVDGRLVAPLPAERHGRAATYLNWGCRCPRCTQAASRRRASYQGKTQ